MTRKLNNFTINNNKIFDGDNKEISIDDYNDLLKISDNATHPLLILVYDLWKKTVGSESGNFKTEYRQAELKHSRDTNRNLCAEVENRWVKFDKQGWGLATIWPADSEDTKKKTLEQNEKVFDEAQELVNLFQQLRRQKEEWDRNSPNIPTHEEWKQNADNLRKWKAEAKQAIESALNEEPQITKSELDGKNVNWDDLLEHTKTQSEINEIKNRVLVDIKAKRNAKKGKREREEQENDNPNKRPKLEEKDAWQSIKNQVKDQTLVEVDDNVLAVGLQAAIRGEGEREWEGEEEIKKGADELSIRNPQLYRKTIITALKERMNDLKVKEADLDEETKKLINGEFDNDMEKFRTVKDQAIKKIGELGAKSKWTSLFSQAQAVLKRAKQNVTAQVKKELKQIEEQIKNFKAGTNSYLASFYQQDKAQVEKLERSLSSYLTQTGSTPNKKIPWGMIIPVSLAAVALVGSIALVIVRNRRRVKVKRVTK